MPPEEKDSPPTPSAPEPQNRAPSPLKQIRTFQGDVAEALDRQQESLFSIQQAERAKVISGGSVPTPPSPETQKQKEFLPFGSPASIMLARARSERKKC